jgi:hypothetical protein
VTFSTRRSDICFDAAKSRSPEGAADPPHARLIASSHRNAHHDRRAEHVLHSTTSSPAASQPEARGCATPARAAPCKPESHSW